MKMEQVADVAKLPETTLRTIITNENRLAALAHAVSLAKADDLNDHVIVRARQFESYLKNG